MELAAPLSAEASKKISVIMGVCRMDAPSDNFWSAFCVFHAHFWGKTHSFKICALKTQ